MLSKRLIESVGMMMIGDGLLSMTEPQRHCMLWKVGPAFCQDLMETFAEHPGMTRVMGGVELALGLWLASNQQPDEPRSAVRRVTAAGRSAVRRAMASV
jgi:hypothetical protein